MFIEAVSLKSSRERREGRSAVPRIFWVETGSSHIVSLVSGGGGEGVRDDTYKSVMVTL